MSNGVPVRLSAELAARARRAASMQERSLTEQVEHWARLGQVIEDAILSATVTRLKARSYDPELPERLARALTADGRARAAEVIRARDPVRYGIGPSGDIRAVRGRRERKQPR